MVRIWSVVMLSALVAGALGAQTRDQTKAFVKQAVEFAKKHPKANFLKEVSTDEGRFHFSKGRNHDLYIFVYDTKGRVLAHGARRELVGLDRWNARDPNGLPWVQERTRLATEHGSGWTEYKELNPSQKNKVMKKASWVELCNGMIIGAGSYE